MSDEAQRVEPFPELRGSSLPSDRFGAWIVQRVTAGWVHLRSADLTATRRMPVDRFNWYWDEFEKARSEALDRAELLAPRGEELDRLVTRFPAPQEFWGEDDSELTVDAE